MSLTGTPSTTPQFSFLLRSTLIYSCWITACVLADTTGNGNAIIAPVLPNNTSNNSSTGQASVLANGNADNGGGKAPAILNKTFEVHTASQLINLTINWKIDNFIFLLDQAELRSPLVSSESIGITEADGDWQLILNPTKTIAGKDYVSLNVERSGATFGNVTGRFGFYILDKKGGEAYSLFDEITNVFTVDPPENFWGWEKFIAHSVLLPSLKPSLTALTTPRKNLLVNGALHIRARLEFLSPVLVTGALKE
ncbi:hypothetical protein RvY_07312 [Ramazzottius varieornatus]|uniref:MATH domain-containing protein n=1 Tax=Ramazzottius varieornatus TaxID=947166 RepID=A0A1D1V1N6_RAMVA|nr:hypothetical protein RvY_07312 [Ramazzottius varieornatus]